MRKQQANTPRAARDNTYVAGKVFKKKLGFQLAEEDMKDAASAARGAIERILYVVQQQVICSCPPLSRVAHQSHVSDGRVRAATEGWPAVRIFITTHWG